MPTRCLKSVDRYTCVLDELRREETLDYLWAILGPPGSRVRTHRDMFGTAS